MTNYQMIHSLVCQGIATANMKEQHVTTAVMNSAMANTVKSESGLDTIEGLQVKIMDALPDGKIILE